MISIGAGSRLQVVHDGGAGSKVGGGWLPEVKGRWEGADLGVLLECSWSALGVLGGRWSSSTRFEFRAERRVSAAAGMAGRKGIGGMTDVLQAR